MSNGRSTLLLASALAAASARAKAQGGAFPSRPLRIGQPVLIENIACAGHPDHETRRFPRTPPSIRYSQP